jgi:hypothetical protein
VREKMINAKQEYLDAMQSLRGKKNEHKQMKESIDQEKKQLKIDEKKAKSFKFNKMEKKLPFFPSLQTKGNFEELRSINVDDKYLDARRRFELMFPDKTFEKDKKWIYIKHSRKFF